MAILNKDAATSAPAHEVPAPANDNDAPANDNVPGPHRRMVQQILPMFGPGCEPPRYGYTVLKRYPRRQ